MQSKRVTTRSCSLSKLPGEDPSSGESDPIPRRRKNQGKRADEGSAYERERMKRIAENREIFKELGLDKKPSVAPVVEPTRRRKLKQGHRAVRRELRKQVLPVRRSRRFKGGEEAAEAFDEARDKMLTPAERKEIKREQLLSKVDSSKYQVPFSLTDTLEIVCLGDLKNSDNGNWWSNPGCLFHHEYPVGYKARKFHWGVWFFMEIKASSDGEYPVFTVKNESTEVVKEGDSPTAPWTDFCIMRRGKERVSGPLFFGFSDPVTIKLIQKK